MSQTVYTYKTSDSLTNDINPSKLQEEIIESSIITNIDYINKSDEDVYIYFEDTLSLTDKSTLDSLVSNHEHITTAESLKKYLEKSVFPFIDTLITTFAAENIALGITQAGKTGYVLGLFEKHYNLGLYTVSLKGSFDTGSLYIAKEVIQHVRDNPSEFNGLDPYVNDTRLLEMKNKIETFLNLPLST